MAKTYGKDLQKQWGLGSPEKKVGVRNRAREGLRCNFIVKGQWEASEKFETVERYDHIWFRWISLGTIWQLQERRNWSMRQ